MPRLLIFAPCQRAIIDRQDSSVSIIAVLQGLRTYVPPEERSIPDATAPLTWAMMSLWHKDPEDEGKTYEQRVQIVQPSGRLIGEAGVTFALTAQTHYNLVRGESFPVAEAGEHLLRLSLRELGSEDWQVKAEYPVEVVHIPEQEGSTSAEADQPADAQQTRTGLTE